MTEGLSSFGFNVINLKLNVKLNSSSILLDKKTYGDIKSLFALILNKFKNQDLIGKSDYILLNLSKSFNPNREVLSDLNEIGYIAVNPRINKHNIGILKENFLNQLQYPQLSYIFSKYSYFILKNNDLRHVTREFDENTKNIGNLITLEKSTNSFKYYETMLLGIIIDIIENKLVKSTNYT